MLAYTRGKGEREAHGERLMSDMLLERKALGYLPSYSSSPLVRLTNLIYLMTVALARSAVCL